ncbi:mannose-6-phosphate isomerase [Microbacterium album]|uniref:Mannose-6-phosphate isomerase n=2 Tax=Microbacterium album TaxID=2053191 RepID=A0A917IHV1_9MICO|nr:mannose-6-phosphate isomerase [Microbacterium album]
MFPGNYELQPTIRLGGDRRILEAGEALARARAIAEERAPGRPLVVVDAYPGVDLQAWKAALAEAYPDAALIDVEQRAALDTDELQELFRQNLTDDRVFGVMSHHRIEAVYDEGKLSALRDEVGARQGPVVLLGWGAALVASDDAAIVSIELARWEITLRYRAGLGNWRTDNGDEDVLRKIKRGFFVEWRIADRHKQDTLYPRADLVIDGNRAPADALAITAEAFRAGMEAAVSSPFRVVPYFDPGVWGGQWMREALGLPEGPENYAWAFDCVPEENSILLSDGERVLELPAIDVVLTRPRELLGARTHARFGPEFPIRFDFLDTMGGGNLSLQVHPLTGYIQDRFGMPYTQDESYYLLDADEDATVYLGLKTGADPRAFAAALEEAQAGGAPFPAEEFVNILPARKHDHFSIPAGTVHCSGANSLVLEISATPYIFTFKLWDWGRLGLDGLPRPVHLEHGLRNIQWDRDTEWIAQLSGVEPIASGDGWTEERTGLHELEFIEVRRHWFTGRTPHHTHGTVNVLNLVEGDEVVVSSPSGSFDDFVVHYAETFIVPAAVGAYDITPAPGASATRFATVKAYVRGTATSEAP